MDFTTITLNAAAKAMQDSVLPALAAANERQALEQAHLVWDALKFARDRVYLINERRRSDVSALCSLMGRLLELDAVKRLEIKEQLARVHAESLAALADPATTEDRYVDLSLNLGDTLSSLLAEVDGIAASLRAEIERTVLQHSLRKLELDRAWLLPLGFDPDPSSVQNLETLLKADVAE